MNNPVVAPLVVTMSTLYPESSLQVSSTDPTARAAVVVCKAMPVAAGKVLATRLHNTGTVPVSVLVLTALAASPPIRRANVQAAPRRRRAFLLMQIPPQIALE